MTEQEREEYRKHMEEGTCELVDGEILFRLPDKFIEMQDLVADLYIKAKESSNFDKVFINFKKYCKRVVKELVDSINKEDC